MHEADDPFLPKSSQNFHKGRFINTGYAIYATSPESIFLLIPSISLTCILQRRFVLQINDYMIH